MVPLVQRRTSYMLGRPESTKAGDKKKIDKQENDGDNLGEAGEFGVLVEE